MNLLNINSIKFSYKKFIIFNYNKYILYNSYKSTLIIYNFFISTFITQIQETLILNLFSM